VESARRFPAFWSWLAALLLGALFLFTAYRAATQSIVCDEALTYHWYVSQSWSALTDRFDANNHVLFTLLSKLSTLAFGTSELTLRLPTVLAAAAYFAAVFLLVRDALGSGPVFLATVAALCANPFVLDYLCAARGYGLALAGLMWALVLLSRSLGRGDTQAGGLAKGLARASIALGLTVAAGLTFALVSLSLGAVALVLLLEDGRSGRLSEAAARRAALALAIPGPVVAAVVLLPFLRRASRVDFYAGHDTFLETAGDLAAASFQHHSVHALAAAEVWASVCLLVWAAGAALAAFVRLWRVRAPSGENDRLLVLVTGALVLALGLHAAGHGLLGMRYPYARGWLWVLPLGTLAVVLAMTPRAGEHRGRTIRIVRAAGVGGLSLAYALQLQASTFRDYAYDAASRTVFARTRSVLGQGRRTVIVAAPSFQCPSFDFYLVTRGAGGPGSCRPAEWPDAGDWDVRILRLEDLAGPRPDGARELFRDEASGTVVFVRE
jgi:hypothetical protein